MKKYIKASDYISFDELKDIVQRLYRAFDENNLSAEIWFEEGSVMDKINYEIRGDWKHDHLFSNHIATEVLNDCGVEILNSTEQETESDGSDWYTAIHTFYIMAQR